MQIFDTAATSRGLAFDRLIPALRGLFAQGCETPARHVHRIAAPATGVESPGDGGFTSLIMPAWVAGRAYGVKIINIAPGNAALELPGLHATYLLFDGVTGVPLAMLDGNELTARRTAAASALAASMLARADSSHLLVVGAGRVASMLPAAYAAVLPIRRVTVWARNPSRARALATDLQAQGFDAHPAEELALAVEAADIVSCATLAREPVVRGQWLRPGTHLDLIGSFTPEMREADDDCFKAARLFVDTPEALVKSGELLGPMSRGVFTANDIQATLEDLCRGKSTRRENDQKNDHENGQERTVFKSVGTALEDLAGAMLVAGLIESGPAFAA